MAELRVIAHRNRRERPTGDPAGHAEFLAMKLRRSGVMARLARTDCTKRPRHAGTLHSGAPVFMHQAHCLATVCTVRLTRRRVQGIAVRHSRR